MTPQYITWTILTSLYVALWKIPLSNLYYDDPSIYTMDHPDFIVCSFMENSIGLKRVKREKLDKIFLNAVTSSWIIHIYMDHSV